MYRRLLLGGHQFGNQSSVVSLQACAVENACVHLEPCPREKTRTDRNLKVVCEKGQTAHSDGPQPSGCFNGRTTLVSKSLSGLEDKWRPGKAHALENIDARPD